jgi:hypothetical protein
MGYKNRKGRVTKKAQTCQTAERALGLPKLEELSQRNFTKLWTQNVEMENPKVLRRFYPPSFQFRRIIINEFSRSRNARWFLFGPKIPIWEIFGPKIPIWERFGGPWNGKC